jgi:putative DNA primase/helicase
LLEKILPINFRDYLKMDDTPAQKHIIVGVVQNVLEIATNNKWNLCKKYDYVYIYNGEFWAQCDRDEIKDFLGKAAIKMGCAEYNALHFEFKEKLLKQFLSNSHLSDSPTEENKTLINLQNGTMEFSDNGWFLRKFQSEDFMTYQLPFGYDKKALCPLFDKYLLRVIPERESRLILQEFCGYIFTKIKLEKCLILLGGGHNGKSVFFDTLSALLGPENTLTYTLGSFAHEYNRARLTNVLLNYSSERGTDLTQTYLKRWFLVNHSKRENPTGKVSRLGIR